MNEMMLIYFTAARRTRNSENLQTRYASVYDFTMDLVEWVSDSVISLINLGMFMWSVGPRSSTLE